MKLPLARYCFLWLLVFLCLRAPAFAQEGTVVQKIEIRHVGPPAASDAMIRANIRLKAGDIFTRNSVDDDVRTLWATGLFYNIRVVEEPVRGGVNVIYVVEGKPTVTDIRFTGNKKYKDKKLRKKLTSKVGEPLDEHKLFVDAQEIQSLYQKAGRQKTTVEYKKTIDENAGTATVTFEIHEAPKIRVVNVEFLGARAFPQKKLRKVIKTRRHWMFSWITGSGVLKDEQFEDDRDRLADFYHDHGHMDFEIKNVKFNYADPKHLDIQFVISEGTQYKVGAVTFQGNKLFTQAQIADGLKKIKEPLKLTPGEVFKPKDLAHDIESIRDFYGHLGYIDVWVKADKIPNVERGTIDLVYEINGEDKGKSYIEKIEIRGNTRTKDKVIRRELAVSPGEVFDMVAVKRSKGRLEQMQYFDKVEAEPQPTEVPNHKDLVIDVEEGTTGNFNVGAGFSSIESFIGFVGYTEGNFDLFNPPYFRGGGQKLRVLAQLGFLAKDFEIDWTEPWFLGRKLALDVSLYYRDFDYFSTLYDITEVGTSVGLTKALGSEFLIGSTSYTIEQIGLNNVSADAPLAIREERRSLLESKIGAGLAYDTRNSVELPTWGQRSEIRTELAGPFGGDTDFYKWELRSSWFFPGFLKGHILEVDADGKVIANYGRTQRVPLFNRFFLGGVYDLRGWDYTDAGPREGGQPIGGDTSWFGSVEYSIPIIERLRFAVFYDVGNVYLSPYSFALAPGQIPWYDDYGFGIRLNIPRLGPLRLDYGIPIHHDQFTSSSGKFQFSVGFQRIF